MTKLFAATALAGMLAAAPAFAQTATPDATAPATAPAATSGTPTVGTSAEGRFITAPSGDDWVASRFIGSTVYSPANDDLGKVNDVVATKDGQVKAVVIGVGGFLGIGEKNVAVAPADVQRVAVDNGWRYQLNTTKEELNAAPEFRVPDMNNASTGTSTPSTGTAPATDGTAPGTATPAPGAGTTTPDNGASTAPATPMAPAAPSTTAP